MCASFAVHLPEEHLFATFSISQIGREEIAQNLKPAPYIPIAEARGLTAHTDNTPLEALRDYYESLQAPAGKQLVVFEESAHTSFMAEPEKFDQEIIRVKEETFR